MLSSMMRPCSVDCGLSVPYHHQWAYGSAESRSINTPPPTTKVTILNTNTNTTAEKYTMHSIEDEHSLKDKDNALYDYDYDEGTLKFCSVMPI